MSGRQRALRIGPPIVSVQIKAKTRRHLNLYDALVSLTNICRQSRHGQLPIKTHVLQAASPLKTRWPSTINNEAVRLRPDAPGFSAGCALLAALPLQPDQQVETVR